MKFYFETKVKMSNLNFDFEFNIFFENKKFYFERCFERTHDKNVRMTKNVRVTKNVRMTKNVRVTKNLNFK